VAIGRELDLGTGLAPQLTNLGVICFELGQLDRSAEYHRQALALHQPAGSRTDEAASLSNVGEVCLALGRLEEALGYLTQSLDLQQEIGSSYGRHETLRLLAALHPEAGSLNTLGAIHQGLAEPDLAAACHEQAVRLARRTASTAPEISALTGLASARLALGLQDAALGHAERAVSMARQVGYRLLEGQARQALAAHRETGHRPGELRGQAILRQIQDAAPST